MSDESGEVSVDVRLEVKRILDGVRAQLPKASTNVRGYGAAHAEMRRRLALIGPQVVWRRRVGRYTLTITKRRPA